MVGALFDFRGQEALGIITINRVGLVIYHVLVEVVPTTQTSFE
jgi:hypothetical protein